jgi:hypothetical protein
MKSVLSRMLPDQDSNLDKLNQNQLYCHYTIGQSVLLSVFSKKDCKNKASHDSFQIMQFYLSDSVNEVVMFLPFLHQYIFTM